MRLGLIGWYGHGNAGDERILYCLRRLFAGDELLVTRSFDDAWGRLNELNRCDFVLLGGGGLIVRGFNRYARLFESLRVPFGCIGLGVEARHADNETLIQVLLDRAEFVLVRDTASQQRLKCYPNVQVGPDLTFLYPYEVAKWPEDDVCGLSLRPWAFWEAEFRGRRDRLMRWLSRRLPALEPLYPLKKWDPARAVAVVRRRCAQVVPLPLHCSPQGDSDVHVLRRFFQKVDGRFRPESLGRCRYLVGMRLHSLIFACQTAIPFVSLSYQPKNVAFCADLGMEAVSVSLYDCGQLDAALVRMKDEAAEIRRRLLSIREEKVRAVWRAAEPLVALSRKAAGPRLLPQAA